MRTLAYSTLVALAFGGGCKWTDFDDLEGDTWVTATDKPNGDSTDYGVALARGARSTSGGKIVVIGAGQAQYTEMVYSPNGDADLAPTALKLNTQFGIGNLDQQPLLLADPTSDEVSLVVNSGGQSIAVLTGSGGLIAHQVFGPEQPDAATYMVPPPRVDMPALATPPQVLVSAADKVYGAFIANVNPQPSCQLVDEANSAVTVHALAAARITSTTYDDVLVWGVVGGSTAKLLIYPGSVFNGAPPIGSCTNGMQGPLAGSVAVPTAFVPAKGSQIVMVDDTHFIVVGHKDVGNSDSFLGYYLLDTSGKTFTAIGAPQTLSDLRTAAILDEAGKKYVVAGYPNAVIDAAHVNGGQVQVFGLDATAGLSASPVMTLYDAQPESDQQFGRAVTTFNFNGTQVIAIAADNEIFVYFKLLATSGAVIYDETRMGR